MAKERVKLPPEAVASLQQAQRDLQDILPDIEGAESCGIDCQQYRQTHSEAMERIEALLTNFGPGVATRRK